MLERFQQNNEAELIRKSIDNIDLSSADILGIEREIYLALGLTSKPKIHYAPPIAPLAEPAKLDELVGDLLNNSQTDINYHIGRLDNLFSWLSETNNSLKVDLETAEKSIMEATDAIQDISIVVGDENRNFFWISDSFNSNVFIDTKNSNCLIDTDYGMVTLGPEQFEVLGNFTPQIIREETYGIPGANLYIVNPGKFGLENKEPEPYLEKEDTRNFSSVFDQDSSTWFEVERNFIPERQKIKAQGRAYVYSSSGEEKNIREVTRDFDWTAIVEWPDGYQDGGDDGKGKSLVEWRDLENENAVNYESNTNKQLDPKARLCLELTFSEPTTFSAIKLLPFVREDSNSIIVDRVQILTGDYWVDVIKDVELGTNRSTTKLQREILRRTGVQILGSLFTIPTDRLISKVRIYLSSSPAKVKNGFGHIFKDILTAYRTERNHIFWNSVDKWQEWGRTPFNANVPKVTSSNSRPPIVGAVLGAANTAYTLGRIVNTLPATVNVFSAGATAPFISNVTKSVAGGSLGAAATWLGKAVPILGAVLALDQLVGGFFRVDKSSSVVDSKVGYDVFSGYRAAVGIRDITLVRNTYVSQSTIQSVKRSFPSPVSKIGLFVDDYVPDHWGPGDWITYFISTDGTNWITVPKITDSTLEKSVNLSQPTSTVYWKAIIKKHPEDKYRSPQIRHYSIQGLPASI